MNRSLVMVMVLAGLVGCTDELKPNRCERPSDCAAGKTCDAFKRCVDIARADGGDAGPDGREGGQPGDASDGPDVGGILTGDAGPEAAGPDAAGTCGSDADCTGATPACVAGRCVACAQDSQCTDAVNRFCVNNSCADCRMAADACAQKGGDKKFCNMNNGACVECLDQSQCPTAGKGFCVMNACTGCAGAGGDAACKAPTAVCDTAGGTCVECTAASHCKEPGKPFCAASKCVPCNMAPAGQTCAMLNAGTPECGPMGACVECNTSANCTAAPARPICQASKCVACTTDAECAAKSGASPGVCLANVDGRCASEADAIHVRAGNGCGSAGTMAQPVCNLTAARGLISATRRLVLVYGLVEGFEWTLPGGGPITIIGKQGAVISGGARIGARFTGTGEVFMRDMTVSYSMLAGIVAGQGTTLRLDRMLVQTNGGGGILLDGARFDIRNTLVSDNGPGQQGAQIFWGGILVQSPPAEGPARLERVSAIMNRQVGVSCSSRIEGTGVLASGNFGGVEATAACGLTLCPAAGPSCGASVGSP